MDLLSIKDPSDIYNLSIEELETLSSDIRKFLIEKVSKTGGHLGGNLGIVELTIALHYYFRHGEKLIFDVGHQCYTHKILTGRASEFDHLRQKGGIAGFPIRSESPYDYWEVGHSSTSIAALSGLIESGGSGIAIIGDGALTGGESFESLEHISELKKNAIIILNDNSFSISKNVGSLNKMLDYLRSTRGYTKLADKNRKNFFLKNIKNSIKSLFYKPTFFDDMGFKYYGPIDGHNFKDLFRYFDYASKQNRPVIIHIVTKKGKGYSFSENDELGKWHCISPFDIKTGNEIKNGSKVPLIKCASEYISSYYKTHKNTKVVIPAMTYSSFMDPLKEEMGDNYIDTGITEQFAISFSSSLALNNVKVFTPVYSSFLQRAYDQIQQDMALQESPLVLLVDKSGIIPGNGKTHHGIYSIPYLLTIPSLTIVAPRNKEELYSMLNMSDIIKKPLALYLTSEGVEDTSLKIEDVKPYDFKWSIINNPKEVKNVLITYSTYCDYLFDELKNSNTLIVNASSIRPLDKEMLISISKLNKPIYVYENSPSDLSLYISILSFYHDELINVNLNKLGLPVDFIDIGSLEELRKDYKLDKESIKELLK